VEINTESGNYGAAISQGLLEVERDSVVRIIADTADRAEEIDIEKAEEARKRAEEVMESGEDLEDVDYARLQAQIEQETAKIQVGKKYKRMNRIREE
jgi:F-type H+-transporting ATPase subunit epsilon